MSPLMLRILLAHYCSPQAPEQFYNRSVSSEQVDHLIGVGLMERYGNQDDSQPLTEKGRVYIEAVLKTPMPVSRTAWVVPAPTGYDRNTLAGLPATE